MKMSKGTGEEWELGSLCKDKRKRKEISTKKIIYASP